MAFLQSIFVTATLLLALVVVASATDYGYSPTPKLDEKPKPGTDYFPHPTKPDDEVPKPKDEVPNPKEKHEGELLIPTLIIGVQGVVLCKSGSNYFPIHGALARVTCGCVDEHGFEASPISALSHITDNKGYFFTTLSLEELGSKKLKLTECKAFLESSPLDSCKVPTDVNYGISGALLSSYRVLDDKIKLHTVGPFFFTSQPTKTATNGY